MDEIDSKIQDLDQRLQAMEIKTQNIQPTAFLNQFSMDPASSGFLQDFIATPYTTTQPTYTPNKNGYENIYFDGSNYWRYSYANGAWRKLRYDGVFSLVAGSGITLSPSNGTGTVTISTSGSIWKSGTTSRGGSDASGNQVIAHGLGRTPSFLRITALWAVGTPVLLQSFGTYDGSAAVNVNSYTMVGTGGGAGNSGDMVLISDHGGNSQTASVTMDATNITLAWTKVGALGNTIYLLWEVT